MASLSSVSSSSNSVSSLMNTANKISGLASGLDTESMIEQLVQSYQTKITQLNQKVTKVEWKQEAYRSIISQMYNFSQKYTSYTSNTNLMSPTFFSSAVKVLTNGVYASSVTATGKTSSDIQLNAVQQLATAAQYRTKSNLDTGNQQTIEASDAVDLSIDALKGAENGGMTLSNLSGTLKLTYGSKSVNISFNEMNDAEAISDVRKKLGDDASESEVLAELINQKLADQKITFTNGSSEAASERIQAVANADGSIEFKELGTAKNGVSISGASDSLLKQFGLDEDELKDGKVTTMALSYDLKSSGGLTRDLNTLEYLAEKGTVTMNINLDGTTKQITMPTVGYKEVEDDDGNKTGTYYVNGEAVDEDEFADKYASALNEAVQKAFGDKISVTNEATDGNLKLKFEMKNEGSQMVINTDVGNALGFGNAATSYLSTGKTLKDLGFELDDSYALKDDEGEYILDDKGKKQYEFSLNGVKIGTYTEDSRLSDIMSDINANDDAGVQVAYSQTTQSFTFTAKETGADSKIELGDGLAKSLFGSPQATDNKNMSFAEVYKGLNVWDDGDTETISFKNLSTGESEGGIQITKDTTVQQVIDQLNDITGGRDFSASYNEYTGQIEVKDSNGKAVDFAITNSYGEPIKFNSAYTPDTSYTAGQDAKFTVTVNGETINMTRSSNTVDIDGLSITMKGTFDATVDENGNKLSAAETAARSVTFTSQTDSDKIIDAIKSMVADYNSMMSEIKSAYNTLPYQDSSGAFATYEPLTDDDRATMTEAAIERYEEKAKQGILFGDRNLSNLYTKLSQAFSFSNQADVDALKDMGITVGYSISDGVQTVQIDETKLRAMLDSEPDKVANLFTKTDGIMDRMKTQLDIYGKTTGEPKGILVEQSGTPLASLSLMSNQWQKEIDNYNSQIETWQDRLASQVERYTSQFTRLEMLIQQMNSQSSTLAGLMGG